MELDATRIIAVDAPPEPARSISPPAAIPLGETLPRLFGYFYPRVGGNRALAEDLTQDTLLSAIRSGSIPVGSDDLMPWLFHIARNKLIDHYRRLDRERRNFGVQVDDDALDAPSLPDLDLESLPQREEVSATLAELNPRYQMAIVLRYLDGCDVATVAQAMFLSQSAAESLLARARNAFRSIWIARNGDHR